MGKFFLQNVVKMWEMGRVSEPENHVLGLAFFWLYWLVSILLSRVNFNDILYIFIPINFVSIFVINFPFALILDFPVFAASSLKILKIKLGRDPKSGLKILVLFQVDILNIFTVLTKSLIQIDVFVIICIRHNLGLFYCGGFLSRVDFITLRHESLRGLYRAQLLVKDPHQNGLTKLGCGLAALLRVFVSV